MSWNVYKVGDIVKLSRMSKKAKPNLYYSFLSADLHKIFKIVKIEKSFYHLVNVKTNEERVFNEMYMECFDMVGKIDSNFVKEVNAIFDVSKLILLRLIVLQKSSSDKYLDKAIKNLIKIDNKLKKYLEDMYYKTT